MRLALRLKFSGTVTTLSFAAVCLAACQVADFSQIGAVPKLDSSVFVPDPSQFARRERAQTAVSPAELVDGGGRCVGIGASATPVEQVEAPAASASGAPSSASAPAPRGIVLDMTECDVIRAAGQPADVQIAANEHGERSVVMTYAAAERPIYRFIAGRLKTIERSAEPPPSEPVRKKKPPPRTARPRAT